MTSLAAARDRIVPDSTAETSECADETVVGRVLGGETEAFAILVRRYQGPLFRHALAVVLDRDIAADLVQDAFVRGFRSLHTCREPARVGGWLFQTLRNRCRDHLKEARRRDVRLDMVAPPADPAPSPDRTLEHTELRRALRHALEALPVDQREALLLHTVEGLSYEAMAARLGASVSALKMRVLRARAALGAALGHRRGSP